MDIILTPEALADLEYWKKTGNSGILKRISALLQSIQQAPFEGIGKPEPLKHNRAGTWSRRINQEHRLTYIISGDKIYITALRLHY